ncbi:MAG: hypothetical protein K9H16_16120, partial [Bacteroidales bacterium]|nr:hypothetical protein [Bacteroidales bacterium]
GAGTYILQEESGLLNFAHETVETSIDLKNELDIKTYLLGNEFVAKSEKQGAVAENEDGAYIHFVRVIEKGKVQVGYSLKTIEEGSETWEGRIDDGAIVVKPFRDNLVKVSILDHVYYINSFGQLFEKENENDLGFSKTWNLKKFEE